MCAFATVHNVESLQEWEHRQLKLKLDKAKTEQEQIAVLHAHCDELIRFLERTMDMHFRVVNLLTGEQLNAYDAIWAKVGPHASNAEWMKEIRKWKKSRT